MPEKVQAGSGPTTDGSPGHVSALPPQGNNINEDNRSSPAALLPSGTGETNPNGTVVGGGGGGSPTTHEGSNLPDEKLRVSFRKEFARLTQSDLSSHSRYKCRGRWIDPAIIRQVDALIVGHYAGAEAPGEDPFWRLNCLVNAGSVVVSRQVGVQGRHLNANPAKRQRRAREDKKVSHYRRLLSWIAQEIKRQEEGIRATNKQRRIRRVLQKVVGCVHIRALLEARERYKSLLTIRSTQIGCQKQKKEAARLNAAYRLNGPSVLMSPATLPKDIPSKEGVGEFWMGVVGTPGNFDPEDEAILAWKRSNDHIECSHEILAIDDSKWRGVVGKIKSWKAPGPDAIFAFWWKIFPGAQGLLRV